MQNKKASTNKHSATIPLLSAVLALSFITGCIDGFRPGALLPGTTTRKPTPTETNQPGDVFVEKPAPPKK